METKRSEELFNEASSFIPGGVNSPVRACGSVGGKPLFIEKAEGAKIYDADQNCFLDYVGSWGPMILGHRHPNVVKAIERVLKTGTSFGAPTELETNLAKHVVKTVPSVEKIRMVNSGTEATMSAIRLARGYTRRNIIIKFDGCYHGHGDMLLVAAGSGVATLNIPGSPGIPEAVVASTLSLKYNDIEGFKEIMDKKGDQVACVIVEPVAGNMGMVPPVAGFHETLREYTEKHGSLLIFDEVMTGFRVAKTCAQGLFGIIPDLSCFGKIIGGGLPVGAYGGRKDIMDHIAPVGPVYQAGTLSGNPLAMAAGIATFEELEKPGFYEVLDKKTDKLINGIKTAAENAGIRINAGHIGSMGGIFFTDTKVENFEDAKTSNLDQFAAYYNGMLEKGIYLAPSQFEALFVSAAHSDEDIDKTILAASEVFKQIG